MTRGVDKRTDENVLLRLSYTEKIGNNRTPKRVYIYICGGVYRSSFDISTAEEVD